MRIFPPVMRRDVAGVVTTFVRTTRRVFLLCSPTALVLWVVFGATYLWTLLAVLGTLSLFVTAWTLTHEEHDASLVETLAVAWFYNVVVSGGAVFSVRYPALWVVFLLGFPGIATVVRGRLLAAEAARDDDA